MKPLICVFTTLLFFTITVFAQPDPEGTDIEGVWTGYIITNQEVPYEVVITSVDEGIYSGYSVTIFTVKGKKMMAVKKLKIEKQSGEIVMTDEDLLFDNFQNKGARDFEQTNTVQLSKEGELVRLNGKFVTKPTRQFRALTGQIRLEKKPDTSSTVIAGKLKEMALWSSLSFLQPKPEREYLIKRIRLTQEPKIAFSEAGIKTAQIRPSKIRSSIALNPAFKTETAIAANTVKPVTANTALDKRATSTASVTKPAVKTIASNPKPIVAKANPPAKAAVIPAKPVISSPAGVKANPPVIKPNVPAAPQVSAAYTRNLEQRQIETIQTVYFRTDSLLVTLYDNGEVDGDTVSLILNGKMILARQGLSTNAVNKTIYLTPDLGDSLQLIMYAENLGSLPPNSGLLIIRDGTERYEIRFSGDLQKNAAINLRRRTN